VRPQDHWRGERCSESPKEYILRSFCLKKSVEIAFCGVTGPIFVLFFFVLKAYPHGTNKAQRRHEIAEGKIAELINFGDD
jgi:hypothetical protein